MKTLIILGSGFDIDLGLGNSCRDFCKSHYCPISGNQYWSDFEGTLRDEVIKWYTDGKQELAAKALNELWQVYVRNISWFFTDKSDKFKCNGRTCAYKFLKRLSPTTKTKVYTFNYTNPYEYADLPQLKEFTYLHGRHYRDTFNKDLMVMSQCHNIILGIDECIPQDGLCNPYIHALIKKNHPIYKDTDIIRDLSKAKHVIIYGFAMGTIDYGYFEDFFKSIKNEESHCEKIYYVTYNKTSFEDFLIILKEKGLKTGSIKLIPIYTKYGPKNRTFRKMLKDLMPYTRYKTND